MWASTDIVKEGSWLKMVTAKMHLHTTTEGWHDDETEDNKSSSLGRHFPRESEITIVISCCAEFWVTSFRKCFESMKNNANTFKRTWREAVTLYFFLMCHNNNLTRSGGERAAWGPIMSSLLSIPQPLLISMESQTRKNAIWVWATREAERREGNVALFFW